MAAEDLALPIASTAATGLSVIWISKVLISSWLRKYDKALDEITSLSKDMAVTLHRLSTLEKGINGIANSLRCRLDKLETKP